MNDPTDTRLLFRNTMRITPGHEDQFREAIVDAVTFARAHAPQLMVDVFVDEEEGTATSFQIYADSDSVVRHWELSDPYIANVMEHCEVDRFEVFGSPSEEVRNGFGRMSGMEVRIHPRLTGYVHFPGSPDTDRGGAS
ncbi:hypothetical protein [Desertimonas flava]|jgi:hypothetical protein|uniref:hypothetical protein n=1 Tax=Desertimonas flava TaxID=2064846 RepID=UPI000E3416AE|nr:hypothetical protein [Desertimonas flava]